MYLSVLFTTTITFWYFLLDVVDFPLFKDNLCHLSPYTSISLSPSPLARVVPSPAARLLLPVLVHVSLWTLALDTVPSPASGAMPCLLSPTPSCSHGMVSQAVVWVDGCFSGMSVAWLPPQLIGWLGERQGVCFLSVSASSYGMDWHGFALSSHHPQGTWALPLSFHRLEPTQNWIWAEWLGIVLRGYLGNSPGKLPPIPIFLLK